MDTLYTMQSYHDIDHAAIYSNGIVTTLKETQKLIPRRFYEVVADFTIIDWDVALP